MLIPESLFQGKFQGSQGGAGGGVAYLPSLQCQNPFWMQSRQGQQVRLQPLLPAGGCSHEDRGTPEPFHHCYKEPPQVFLPLSLLHICLLADQLCGTSSRLQPGLAIWLLSNS